MGSLWGILEYLAQSNFNTEFVPSNRKFKFIDDLSLLEKINLMSIEISSYNFKNHVASDIPNNGFFIPNKNLMTQSYLEQISEWTSKNKMELNKNKTKAMIFNFTKQFQFTSRICIENILIEIISETKLLGIIVTDDLTWDKNTIFLTNKANARMRLLHCLAGFSVPLKDLVIVFILFIRSVLEQSCQVWHSSLTLQNTMDLERVQKHALKVILKSEYLSYENALEVA